MPESRISSCVGCRLRRRKCDQKRPICTACDELKIPIELCVYRKMSLVSKDAKTTLGKLKTKNAELKKQQSLYQSEAHALSTNSHNRTPLEREPLFRTVRESLGSLSHFGSTSWAALTDTEPILKPLLVQVHLLLKHERDEYDTRRKAELKMVNEVRPPDSVMKGRSLLSQMGLEREDHLDFIKEILLQVQEFLPSADSISHYLRMYKDYNSMKALGSFLVDFDSLNQAVTEFLIVDQDGNAKFNINLPEDLDKMSYVLLFLSSLSFMVFVKNQSITQNENKDVNYLVFLEYFDALFNLLHNYLADNGELRLLYTVETFQALFISGTFQKYVPHGKMIDDSDGAKTAVYIRKITSLGKLLNLNKNVDIYYAHKTAQVRRSLKSLWYSVAAYDSLEALEIGIPPKIQEPFVRYDDFASQFTELPIVMNHVLILYNKIELMEDTDKFLEILKTQIIKPLKDLLRNHFASLEEDLKAFENYDFNNNSSTQDFFTRGQSFSLRCLIYSTIQTFYHISYKRLRILNERSQRTERIKLLTWKYTLLVPFVMKELFKAYNKLVRHENSDTFYPVASLLMAVFPYMRLAQRRITIFACARFLEDLNYDQVSSTAKRFFYQCDNRENEIYEMLKQEGLYQKDYDIIDYGDLDLDDHSYELFQKLKELNDTKYIIVTLAKTMQSSIQLLANDRYNFNFVTFNYIFFFLIKMSNFFLNQAFPNTTINYPIRSNKSTPASNTEFDFNELFEKAIDTRSQKFDFTNFFTNSYSSTINDTNPINNDILLEDFFSSLDMPSASDSKLYYSWYK